MLHMAILRSPYAHAKIKKIDTSKASAHAGVVAVYTGEDFKDINPLPCAWQAEAGRIKNVLHTPRLLEMGKVTHTGAGVACVVATDRYTAEDALALIEVDWEVLPAVVDAADATKSGAPQLYDDAPNNICFDWSCGDKDKTATAIKGADVVIKQKLINQRLIPTAMEPRGVIAQYSPATEEWTIWMTSQAPHVMRLLMTAFVFGVPETRMRVISPQVGGGFGAKIYLYHEYCLATAITRKLGGRPVKWMETRRENYVATTHGRDHVTEVEVGVKRDGTVVGLNVNTYANLGGILSTIAPGIPTTLYGRLLSGPYKFPNIHCNVKGVYTNTGMVDAYRGAGRPEATYLLERVMDMIAGELKMEPAEVRRKNFVPSNAFPYQPAHDLLAGLKYDSGNYEGALNRALEFADYKGMRAFQAKARAEGRLVGIGFSSYIELCGVAPSAWIGVGPGGQGWGAGLWESANVRVHLTGKVVVTSGSQNHGQGHETTMAQVVAHELGVPMDDVIVQHSDTLGAPFGYGSYGSRSAAVGATAVFNSVQKVKEKAKKLAAHMLEASEADMVYEDGKIFVKGSPDKSKTIQEVALSSALGYSLPKMMEPFLDDTAYFDPPNCTYPFGTHISMVEVDKETGHVKLLRYVAVDDVGNVINPMIVDGQLHGGIAQGVAQALYEGAVYDENGQLLTGSLIDYALPKAENFPMIELDRTVTPSPVNPLGVKGAGEAGTIASTPCVANAVMDAIGKKHVDLPLTPQRVWSAMNS
jgi:carbon-monoxide dehydrogenase large subunit